ncbi:hypothetical protein [Ectobacillus ponti]|uniref:Uncharacterized protein n=1 Tax=Ectobacillus ponti TaxID=2961894 RepID=A0AA41X845_9BACI|nr:hypothetical protein [Ectobacillus ponti]MCP8968434.1 hypothetical protein [Ectobacillus ponti]
MKRYLSSLCFLLIAAVQIIGHYTGWGIFAWGMTVVFLLLGAYFTKYLKKPERA